MKSLITFTLVTGLVSGVFSIIEKSGRLVDQSKVSYNLSDDKTFHGAFEIKDVKDITRLRGSYTNNSRSGNWYCFDTDGKMVLRYNYDLKKLVSLDQEQLSGLTITVIDKNSDVSNNASAPIPICSIDQLKKIVEEQLKNDMPAKLKAEGGKVSANFIIKVNPEGEAKYFAEYVFKEVSYTTMVFVKNKIFQIDWLPATFEGKAYKSEVAFSSSFELTPGDHKRFIWNQ